MSTLTPYQNQMATQMASLSALPLWYPFFAKSIYQRSQVMQSKVPGDLSHSTFFKNRWNYYRGITANLPMQPLYPLTDWVLGGLLQKIGQANQRDPNIGERLGAGFITGAMTAVFANPYEVTIIAAQKHSEKPYRAFKRVLNDSGVKGFYKGSLPMGVRNGTFLGNLLITTPALQKGLDPHIPGSGTMHDIVTTILASTIPASIYICIAVPLDFMAIMRQSDPSGRVYASAFQAMNAAYHKHGKSAFKAGLSHRLVACIIEMAGFNLFRNFYTRTVF